MGSTYSDQYPEVAVSTGKLRGRTQYTPAGTKYHSFLGIPYGKPPVGARRFKAPEPAEPWTGVWDAGQVGNRCPSIVFNFFPYGLMPRLRFVYGLIKNLPTLVQRVLFIVRMSEDCLYLNVYAPQNPAKVASARDDVDGDEEDSSKQQRLLPVLFWIHGGGWRMTDANPDVCPPDHFLEKGVVVVTMNYRLGPFGFLSLGTPNVPGNAGLKDQALALRWTRDNIRAFGGDPDAITLYGESAGGVSAHLMQVSPLCKGMFRGVIAASGMALTTWALTRRAEAAARVLAKHLGLAAANAESLEELAAQLRGVSAFRMTVAAYMMERSCVSTDMRRTSFAKIQGETAGDSLMLQPVVEPEGPGAFLTEMPEDIISARRHADVPLMMGLSTAEFFGWLLFAENEVDKQVSATNDRPNFFLPNDLYAALSPSERLQCNRELVEHYMGPDVTFGREALPEYLELWNDSVSMSRLPMAAGLHVAHGQAPVYAWRFNFVGRNNVFRDLMSTKITDIRYIPEGAAHSDILCYLSPMRILPQPHIEEGSREDLCRKRLVELWANFVKTGDPTPAVRDKDILPVRWEPCDRSSFKFLDIDDGLQLKTDELLFPRQRFWEGVYFKYLGKPLASFASFAKPPSWS